MVLSPRALSYARDALESLFRNSLEALQVRLITDSEEDKQELSEAVASLDAKATSVAGVLREGLGRPRGRLSSDGTAICAPFGTVIRAGAKSPIRCS